MYRYISIQLAMHKTVLFHFLNKYLDILYTENLKYYRFDEEIMN